MDFAARHDIVRDRQPTAKQRVIHLEMGVRIFGTVLGSVAKNGATMVRTVVGRAAMCRRCTWSPASARAAQSTCFAMVSSERSMGTNSRPGGELQPVAGVVEQLDAQFFLSV
jgi:hypothetical protein